MKQAVFMFFVKLQRPFVKKQRKYFFHILTSPYLYNRKYQTL